MPFTVTGTCSCSVWQEPSTGMKMVSVVAFSALPLAAARAATCTAAPGSSVSWAEPGTNAATTSLSPAGALRTASEVPVFTIVNVWVGHNGPFDEQTNDTPGVNGAPRMLSTSSLAPPIAPSR